MGWLPNLDGLWIAGAAALAILVILCWPRSPRCGRACGRGFGCQRKGLWPDTD
jgi:hypothetical protein